MTKTFSYRASMLFAAALAVSAVPSSMSTAIAQDAKAPAAAAIKAGTYKVEAGHTQIVFSLLHFGFSNYSGFFSGASGTLQLDPAHLAASKLNVSVPIESVLTTSTKLDGELKGADWFDAAKYPAATFVSTSVTPGSGNTASIAGDLTIRGITKPVTLKAHLVGGGVNPISKADTVGFEATGTIKRSDFGVSKYVPLVGDDVTLTIAGAFELQK